MQRAEDRESFYGTYVGEKFRKKATNLLDRILQDLPKEGLTMNDILESFTALDGGIGTMLYGNSFNENHVGYLTSVKLLVYDKTAKTYSVNLEHPYLTKKIMEEQLQR